MKKFFSIIYIFLIATFSTACVFPDRLPDWKEISSYSPEHFEFRKTTPEEFTAICPGTEPYAPDGEILIFTARPVNVNNFTEVNVGFRHKSLDWIEFVLNRQVEINDFITLYGFPEYIDTKYSETLDYYNYNNFSVSVDKKHLFARSISVFETSEQVIENNLQNENTGSGRKRFFEVFPGLKPGITTEREFSRAYPGLLPYMEGEFDLNSTYTLVEELKGAGHYYRKAILRFENGVLTWINLVPSDEEAINILKYLNKPKNTEKIDNRHDFYVFDNFILTVDNEQEKVNNIGLVNSDGRF